MRLTSRGKTALTVAVCTGAFVVGMTTADRTWAQGDRGDHRVEFYKVTQDVGTNGIVRFILRGDGCLKTEDATKLRLVEYDPSHHKVVYRCTTP